MSCHDNHKEVTTNQKKTILAGPSKIGWWCRFARTTDFDMRSQVSGMSVREVLQEPSRTADSSDKELLSDMWKASATHIFTWWNGGDYYSGQPASGLLAPVFSRSEGRSAKDHYPFKSHRLHQHMQVVNSWQQIQSRKENSQLRLRKLPRRLLAPKWMLGSRHCLMRTWDLVLQTTLTWAVDWN